MIKVLALIFLFHIYGQGLCHNGTRPNIVMVMSDAFVSMNEVTMLYCSRVTSTISCLLRLNPHERTAIQIKQHTEMIFFLHHSLLDYLSVKMSAFSFLQDGRLTFDPGSKVVQLPYINYLRELGTTFLSAYTNSPICCPSRAGKRQS